MGGQSLGLEIPRNKFTSEPQKPGMIQTNAECSSIQALICTAILCGITAPALVAVILRVSDNKKIIEEFGNSKTINILCFAA